MLSYNQVLIRKAASLARRNGFVAIVSDSKTTESSYLVIAKHNSRGTLDFVAELRVSNHRLPGRSRAGWMKYGYTDGCRKYDLRPRSKRVDREKLDSFFVRVGRFV